MPVLQKSIAFQMSSSLPSRRAKTPEILDDNFSAPKKISDINNGYRYFHFLLMQTK